MARIARRVIPNVPHHIIQRGNRKQDVFFSEDDYRLYMSYLRDQVIDKGIQLHAYCLMTNHIHLIVTPLDATLRPIGEAHRRYARHINKTMGWSGHLWQGRFSSYPMDARYTFEAVRYVELNPVRAGLCTHPAHYRWSSARQRLAERSHDLVAMPSMEFAVDDWEAYWQESLERDSTLAQTFIENEAKQQPLGII